MTLPALMLAAAAAAAAVDVSTGTAYWSKSYRMPASYRLYSVALEADDQAAAVRRAENLLIRRGAVHVAPPRSIRAQGPDSGYWPSANQGLWMVAASSAAIAAEELRKLPGLYRYDREGGEPPAYPELYEKRDGLRREIERLGGTLSSLPAIRGLLEAELTTLQRLIYAHESAQKEGYILLTVDGPRRTPPVFLSIGQGPLVASSSLYTTDDPRAAIVRLSSSTADAWRDWHRSDPSACGPIDLRLMALAFEHRSDGEALILKEAERQGGAVIKPACVSMDSIDAVKYDAGAPVYFEFGSRARLDRFARRLQERGRLVSWSERNSAGYEMASAHRSRLRKDEAALPPDCVMVRGLVAAEIERLTPFADQYERALKKPAVGVLALSER